MANDGVTSLINVFFIGLGECFAFRPANLWSVRLLF